MKVTDVGLPTSKTNHTKVLKIKRGLNLSAYYEEFLIHIICGMFATDNILVSETRWDPLLRLPTGKIGQKSSPVREIP